MRTLRELRQEGVTRADRERGWTRIEQGVYGEGCEPATPLERALATVIATGGVASGRVAGALHGLDGVEAVGPDVTVPCGSHKRQGVRRRPLPDAAVVVVSGYRCTSAIQTLCDLAVELDDVQWEQALESVLRKRLASVPDVARAVMGSRGADRMRRVLRLRPRGAPPTGSLLETLMVQLARRARDVPTPERQVEVLDRHGAFVAFVDLAWPNLGLFVELDGQQHKDQPVYEARRETAVVAATGWLCGRFTWREVVDLPGTTARRLAGLIDQARRRPLAG
jgi:hypothetical protein